MQFDFSTSNASKGGISEKIASESIERIAEVASRFNEFSEGFAVRKATLKQIGAAVVSNLNRLL